MRAEEFGELVASVREGADILAGRTQPSRSFEWAAPDVRRLRIDQAMSQSQFAAVLGISVKTLRNWEQGRRAPEGPARVLLQIVAKNPEAVWAALSDSAAAHPAR